MKSFTQLLALCLLFACAMDASASMGYIRRGEVPVLAPDEGLVVIDVDTNVSLGSVRINRNGTMSGGTTITVSKGRNGLLFAATAGSYHLDSIVLDGYYEFNFSDGKKFPFVVKSGVINYPGDLVFRQSNQRWAIIRASNRCLGVIDELRLHFGALYDKYRFLYSGLYPDPFPEFYQTARIAQPTKSDKDLDKSLPLPVPGKLPIAVEDLFRPSRLQRVSLSPDGRLLAEAIYEKNAWHLDLIDLGTNAATRLFDLGATGLTDLRWAGSRALAATLNDSSGSPFVYVIRIDDGGSKGLAFTTIRIQRNGEVIDTVPGDSDHLLFGARNDDGSTVVHMLDIRDAQSAIDSLYSTATHMDRGLSGAFGWWTDGAGRLRYAIAKNGKNVSLYFGGNGEYRPVLDLPSDDDDLFDPRAVSADGNLMYGLSEKDRNQRDLVSFDPVAGTFATVYSKPGVDIDEPVFDAHRRLIGAAYQRNGLRVVDYFGKQDQAIADSIARAFPDSTATVLDRDDAGKQLILAVERSDQPTRLYQLDMKTATASLLEEAQPWLDDKHLAPSRVVHATGSDGTPIEAYLTLPVHASGKSPLIVYPHGGPIGVRDSIAFDPSVQLFASLGYAVLQVNFRGSDGYGRAFRDAGRHHYGGLIEDDIDAATQAVLKAFPLDGDRMCVVGASYGGYSALVSSIRWPKRFRCAVSISGVSDQLLMFTASDTAQTEAGRKALVTAVGDPVADRDVLLAYAPLYRYKELTLPLLLVHGTDDQRVDYEHTLRLTRMLNLAGRPPVVLTLVGEGHGGFDPKDEIVLWNTVAAFLQVHLDNGMKAATARN
jgi:dipeptidyl aminopeptidase/acylaminoacyl peptidase